MGDIGPEVQHFDVLPVGRTVAPPTPVPAPDPEQVADPSANE